MLAVALIIVVALVAAGGVWYWRAHKSNANPSQSQDASAIQTTSTYQNTDYGISFDYPNNWTVKPADAAEGDYGLYTPYGPYQNASTTVSLVTVEISPSLYPGTNLKGAYFNLSVNKQLNQSQCLALTSQPGPNNGGGKITIGGVVFNWTRAGSTAAGTDEFSENYSGYTNGTCYEFNLGDATGNDVSPTGTRMSGSANDIPALEGVLSSVKFVSSAQNSPSSSTPASSSPHTTVTAPSSSRGGTDTSSWQTESIHFNPSSICWTIKYPPTLSPIGANGGESSDEEFVSSQTLTPPVTGVTLAAVFNEAYSSVATSQTFTTDSGLNGSIATNTSGNWRIFVQASEGGNDFVFVLNPYENGGQTPIYDLSIAEAMARSITLSCAIPASPN
jgi:hypothetical protein